MRRATEVLAAAESALRDLMSEGLREKAYAEVAELAGLADALAKFLKDRGTPLPAEPEAQALPHDELPPATSPAAPAPAPSRGARRPLGKRDFPRFERDGDKLVKLGWSKKNRAQYEHKAPRPAVVAVVQQMARVVKPDHVFGIESLLPVTDAAGEEVPGYQVYLTMAWLRSLGAVQKKGRDGYVVRKHAATNGAFDDVWGRVSAKSLG
ncbi:MAG: hypothetical protein HZB39_12205 [Planctomycetes bacterium]|nr:hypothetical protein [Planctomycetota bacterium]